MRRLYDQENKQSLKERAESGKQINILKELVPLL